MFSALLLIGVLNVNLPDQVTTGVPFDFTITAPGATYTGTVHVTSSDSASPSFPFDYTFTPADAGTHTFTATLSTAGRGFDTKGQSVTASDGSNTGTDVTTVKWNPSLVRGFTFANPATVQRTVPFDMTVYARNADGNVVTSFTGTVHLRYTPGVAPLADYTFTPADAGAHTFSVTAFQGQPQGVTAELADDPATGFSTGFNVTCPEFTVTAGNTGPMCPSGGDPNVHLYATASEQNVTSWSWSGPYTWTSGEQNPTPPQPGSYSLNAMNSDLCSASAITMVEAKPAPQPELTSSSITVCDGHATVSVADPSSYSNYVWSLPSQPYFAPGTIVSGQGTPTIEIATNASSGVMSIELDATYTPSGCAIRTGTTIELAPPVSAHISVNPATCSGSTGYAWTSDEGNAQYAWTITNGTILSGQGTWAVRYSPSSAADVTLSVKVTRRANSCAVSDTTTVAANGPHATIDASPATVCRGTEVTVPVTLTGQPPFTIVWSDGVTQSGINATSTTRSITADDSRTYTIVRVNDSQCSGGASGEAVIDVEASEITTQPQSATVSPGTKVTLTAAASGPVLHYDWYQGTSGDRTRLVATATSPSYTTPPIASTTSYWVEAVSSCGAAQSSTATITVLARRRPTRF